MITDGDLVAYSSKMPGHYFEVAMWYVQGNSRKEIAALLNTPIGTVKSRLHRATKLIIKLKEQDQGENAE